MKIKILRDLKSDFLNVAGYDFDTQLYSIENIDNTPDINNFSYGITTIYPGTINGEYYMTKGHKHENAYVPEVYYCLSGEGILLLDDNE